MKKQLQLIILTFSALLLFFSGSILGQIAAGSYTVGTGGTEDYSSLKEVCDSLFTQGVSGDVVFLITTDLTEPVNVALGIDPSPNSITFKPSPTTTPTIKFTQNADNDTKSGAWVFGTDSTDGNAIHDIPTKNIIIDGSNTNGGTTKDLSIITDPAASTHKYHSPFRLYGDVQNVTIKNCNIESKQQTYYPVWLTYNNAKDKMPKNITFKNCTIRNTNTVYTYARAFYIQGYSTAPTATGIVIDGCTIVGQYHAIRMRNAETEIKNCTLEANRYGIALETSSSSQNIHDNNFKVHHTHYKQDNYGIYCSNVQSGSTVNIYNNTFSELSTQSTSVDYGAEGIRVATAGTYTIYNNMFYGFAYAAAGSNCNFTGIYVRGTSAASANTCSIYHNTILMNDVGVITGDVRYRGIRINSTQATESVTVKNNIIKSVHNDTTHAISFSNHSGGTFDINYNDYYGSDSDFITGYWDADRTTLADWQTASSQDANSVSKDVNFVSTTDLHITGASKGDTDLIGTYLAAYSTDIDGDVRNNPPYLGADETTPAVPVELTDFTASIVDGGVMLNWTTATEVNNYGFEVEKSVAGKWTNIGFVEGHGNSNAPEEYSFLDNNAKGGSYRLKQIDADGNSEYSDVVNVGTSINKLDQNYPNPFNPTTVISFSIKASSKITLSVYNSLGQQVATLVNEVMDAGYHEVNFNGSNLASGFYVYRLDAPNYSKTMKMMLIK